MGPPSGDASSAVVETMSELLLPARDESEGCFFAHGGWRVRKRV